MLKVALIIFAIVFLIIYFERKSSENFDTYANHTVGAQKFYALGLPSGSDADIRRQASTSLVDTERLAKYTWNERSPAGTQIYDLVYGMNLRDNGSSTRNPDTKNNTSYSPLNGYTTKGMEEKDPLFTVFNGETITLSQKTF